MALARRQFAARLPVAVGLLIFAGFALINGLDRQAKFDPRLAALVPAIFADESIRVRGAALLGQGKALEAAELGSLAIAHAPLDPQSAALLGAGRLGSGDYVGAERAFHVAGQLGWRVPVTQAYWMGQALKLGDYRIAALRLDAILRQQPELLLKQQLLDPLERNPAGRVAVIDRLALQPPWLRNYTHDVSTLAGPVMMQRTELLNELAQRRGPLGCAMIQSSTDRLAELGLISEGGKLWRAHCPEAGGHLLADRAFALVDLNNGSGAYGWAVLGDGDLQISLVPRAGGSGSRIAVEGNGSITRPFLSQMVVLMPGNYALSWRAVDSSGKPSSGVLASLVCRGDPPNWQPAAFDPASRHWYIAANAGPDCNGYIAAFGARGQPGSFFIDQVDLVPSAGTAPVSAR